MTVLRQRKSFGRNRGVFSARHVRIAPDSKTVTGFDSVDLKGRDIRVNVLGPGDTDTPGIAQFMTDDVKAAAAASVPLGCLGMPDDLGKAAIFLASDDNAYVTGIELFVDGGVAQF